MKIKDESGVTLIELLAVISLVGVVLLLIASAQFNWFSGTTNLPKQTLNQEKLRFAVGQIVKDIEEAQVSSVVITSDVGSEQTLSLEITKATGLLDTVTYQFDMNSSKLSVDTNGNNIALADEVNSFIITELANGSYGIEAIINDIDPKTGEPYKIATSAKPIVWKKE